MQLRKWHRLWSKWQHAKCGDQRQLGEQGSFTRPKSACVNYVFVHVVLFQVSWHCQNCELCSPQRTLKRTVWLGLVSDLRNQRNYGVIECQCMPCEKQAFQYVDLLFCFSFSWIYSKANLKVECHNKCSPGILFCFFSTTKNSRDYSLAIMPHVDIELMSNCTSDFCMSAMYLWW